MQSKNFLISVCLFLFFKCFSLNASGEKNYIVLDTQLITTTSIDTILVSEQMITGALTDRPTPLLQRFRTRQKNNQKITAAILAFPLPFGIVGLHRIYLGCAPYVPVVYIASFGGVLGLIPLIDFCCILLNKDLKDYTNNKKVFMWVK
jgi:TM2 domain-containing membrane protein YozV